MTLTGYAGIYGWSGLVSAVRCRYCCKLPYKIDSSLVETSGMTSRILATVLGLVAQIEREFVKSADQGGPCQAKGRWCASGTPSWAMAKVKLDAHEIEIRWLLSKGVSITSIAKIVECSRSTLYGWIKRRGVKYKGFISTSHIAIVTYRSKLRRTC